MIGYSSCVAQTVTDFADASHSKSAKSATTTVSYGIFSSENFYPCTVTMIVLGEKLSIYIEVWYYNYKKFATIPRVRDRCVKYFCYCVG